MKREYICAGNEYCTREKHVNASFLRKEFVLEKKQGKYELEISVCGFYKLYLNGKDITKGYFAPYINNPDDVCYYDEYDVTDLLGEKNVIVVLLGNGFNDSMDGGIWDFESAAHRSSPKFWLEIRNENSVVLESDQTFEAFDSPITYDDIRGGERFDARIGTEGIFEFGSGIKGKKAVLSDKQPKGEYKKCDADPVKTFEGRYATTITKTEEGYIYDFGVDDSAVYTLSIDGKSGQEIDLLFGEVVSRGKFRQGNISFLKSPKGYVQHDVYVCKDGKQTYTPTFTYHGFRYALVNGITEAQATKDLLFVLPIHSDIERRGEFSCSDETVNKLQSCTIASDVSNIVAIPMDCPQREKNGWTADTSLSCEQFLYNLDCGKTLKEWLFNINKAQREDGALPGIIPTGGWGFVFGNGPSWDSVLIELPYQLNRFYGDTEVITENAAAIKKYFAYLKTRLNASGLLEIGLGDWVEAGTQAEGDHATPVEVTDSLTTMDLLFKSAELFEKVGIDCKEEKAFRVQLEKAFAKKWIKDCKVACNTQTAQAFAIHCGLFKGEDLKTARKVLVDLVHKENDHFKVGVIGARYLFDELSNAGEAQLALDTITNKTFPSYRYWLDHGATTLWESFDLLVEEEGVMERANGWEIKSLNHHFWGCISAWFYKSICGLQVVSENEIELSPAIPESLDYASCSFASNGKFIEIKWQRKDGKIFYEVKNDGFTLVPTFANYETESKKSLDGKTVFVLK